MSTRLSGDGVNAGDYNVVFNIAKSPVDPTPLVLPKYTDVTAPPYKITVDQDIDNLEYTVELLPCAGAK